MGRMKECWSYREAYDVLMQAKSILRALHEAGHIDIWDYGHPLHALSDASRYIDDQLSELQLAE